METIGRVAGCYDEGLEFLNKGSHGAFSSAFKSSFRRAAGFSA